MDYISTSELRKKAIHLRDSLKRGEEVYLFHRSKVIGIIEPYQENVNIATSDNLKDAIKKFSTGKMIPYTKRKSDYHSHLRKKYGEDIS